MDIIKSFKALSKFERWLWIGSLCVVSASFIIGAAASALTLIASLIGATALIFVSKGDVLGQILTVIFSVLYAIISLELRYYGEMITYMGMTAPIAVLSVIAWLRNPYKEGCPEVKIARLSRKNTIAMVISTILVTTVFYFILAAFNTANLAVSTVSIATSYLASYLMLFRSPAYAAAYAANDIVLITLWVLASVKSLEYLPMAICFAIFLINDAYGFYNWTRIMKRQQQGESYGNCEI